MARRDFWKAEAQAAEVLAKRRIYALPIDPFAIATGEGIACEKLSGSGVSGCLSGAGNTFGIFYSGSVASEGFRRFTVAHELGHYFLEGHYKHIFADGNSRHVSDSGFSSDNPYEREADAFAAALLMPEELFSAACAGIQSGLKAIETLAEKCVTSLTATAIRYAVLSDDPITVICSKDSRVQFAFMSETLKQRRDLTWIMKNSGIPDGTATSRFNRDPKNIAQSKRMISSSLMDVWFACGGTLEVVEEVIGLGNFGVTLTVLYGEALPDPERRKIPKKTTEKICCLPTAGASHGKIEVALRQNTNANFEKYGRELGGSKCDALRAIRRLNSSFVALSDVWFLRETSFRGFVCHCFKSYSSLKPVHPIPNTTVLDIPRTRRPMIGCRRSVPT